MRCRQSWLSIVILFLASQKIRSRMCDSTCQKRRTEIFGIGRLIMMCLLIATALAGSGCVTTKWSRATTLERLNPVYRYERGSYTGIRETGGTRYHDYLFPNLLERSDKTFLEILIPAYDLAPAYNPTGSVIVRAVGSRDMTAAHYKPAYLISEQAHAPTNPCASDNAELWQGSLTSDYPLFIIINLQDYGQIPQIRYAQRMKSSPGSGGCGIWYWSDVLTAENAYRPYLRTGYAALRYTGYLVTVPIDVVTSPIQGVLIYWALYNWGHSH